MISIYELLVSAEDEMKVFRLSKVSGATFIYFANKYLNLVSCAVSMLQMAPMSDEVSVNLNSLSF